MKQSKFEKTVTLLQALVWIDENFQKCQLPIQFWPQPGDDSKGSFQILKAVKCGKFPKGGVGVTDIEAKLNNAI